ncbi:MAG: class I SAM-dependent methyltransferase [Gammaproteobacteria bacterium]|nr:class I SAM-dependent methyltransferase [Gammaproteobacteria bacterium]
MNKIQFRDGQKLQNIMPASILHPLDESYYTASHLAFRQATNQQEKIIAWFARNAQILATHDPMSILSIGSGTGILDKKLIPLFQQLVSQIRYIGIDPNEEECVLFEEHTKILCSKSVHISVYATKLEDYETEQRFDLALMVHAVYYFPNPLIPILTLYNLLKPKGKGVIIVAPDNALSSFFKKALHSMWGYQPCLSPTVESILLERKIPYDKHSVRAQVNVTECLTQRGEVEDQLLSFILHSNTRKMPTSNKRELIDYLASMSYKEDGNLYIPHAADIYIVNKTP